MATFILSLVIIILLAIIVRIMSDQNTPSIKAIVPDSDSVQKNSAHVDSVPFIQVSESEDESKSQEVKEEK